ncbi:MAG TPA: PIG-L deacetylase family protein [Pirellulales bacterium]|nr:PIG-L deacetylase family protein [Pirellulales bacterium]
MLPVSFDHARTVLCLGAHADDIEIGCGAALIELLGRRRREIDIHWVVFSADDVRRREAVRSAERFLADAGKQTITIHDFRDTCFPFVGADIKERFTELRSKISPDVVFTHRREDLHQDHRLLAELTWCAFRDHLVLEYEIPKYEGDLGHPNVFVPVSEAACRRKIETLLDVFPSQRAKPWFTADTFWSILRLRGLECNSPTRFAESFTARKLVISAVNPDAAAPMRTDAAR